MLIYITKTAYERGEGVKNLKKYAYVICESPLRTFFFTQTYSSIIIGAKLGGAAGLFLPSPGSCFKVYRGVKSRKIPILHQHYLSYFGANEYNSNTILLKKILETYLL